MKVLIIFLTTATLFSCTQKTHSSLSEEQKAQIKGEIQPVIEQIYDAAAKVDTAKLYDVFSFAGDDFTYLETSGAFYDKNAYKNMVQQFYAPLKSEVIEKGTEKYTYLSAENVLWSYSGRLIATYKTGKVVTYDPFGMTMLFKKTNDKWKVVFMQESTQEHCPTDTIKL